MLGVVLAALAMLGRFAILDPGSARGTSLGRLNSELSANRADQQQLARSVASLRSEISTLDAQIELVRSREVTVEANLNEDRARLQGAQAGLSHERAIAAMLRRRLTRARRILARQLVGRYEQQPPSLVDVVLQARSFNQLLEQLDFLRRAQHEEQTTIIVTRAARARADAATARIARLRDADQRITTATATEANALRGMNALLASREQALSDARAAEQAALSESQARGASLRRAIARVQAQQAAAERAAEALQLTAASGVAALGPSGGWAIPYQVVLCESGGQNLPPNGAGASGYYQIIPSTWRRFGGSGPAAYLTPKTEQDAVAARIWNGGSGASNWVCAGLVGIG